MTDEFSNSDEHAPAADAAVSEASATDPSQTSGSASNPAEEVKRERDELKDRLLRLAAEFDNYRKRIERERREQAEAAVADAVADLLPIVDDLERALAAMTGDDAAPYRKGVELIHLQMLDLLRKRGVRPIEAVGADFDPNFHQAVATEEGGGRRDGEIVEELRRGYMIGDRLLRASMVKVAKA